MTVKLSKIGSLDAGLGGHLPTYLSSALDGPVGIAAAAHVAQTLDPALPWPDMAHGLATGRLFEEELSTEGPLTVRNRLDPPSNGFGLGVELDERCFPYAGSDRFALIVRASWGTNARLPSHRRPGGTRLRLPWTRPAPTWRFARHLRRN